MRGLSLGCVLASTAVALLLTTPGNAFATSDEGRAAGNEAAMPAPEPTDAAAVPAADVEGAASKKPADDSVVKATAPNPKSGETSTVAQPDGGTAPAAAGPDPAEASDQGGAADVKSLTGAVPTAGVEGATAEKPADDSAKAAAPNPETGETSTVAQPDGGTAPAAAGPNNAEASEPEGAPNVRTLTGRDLVKAPIASELPAADVPVAEKLRDHVANRLGKFIDRPNERAAVEAFYRDRGFAPLWTTNGTQNARASDAIAYLRGVAADGLDPADYPMPELGGVADPDARAEADIKMTASVLNFARHARTGRVHFSRVSAAILYEPQYPDPAEVLAKVTASDNLGETLDSYNPQQPGYKALKAKLAEERAKSGAPEEAVVRVPSGPMLRPGTEDARVPILRERLKLSGRSDSLVYDEDLVEAVKAFQREAHLVPDGLVGPGTLRLLNGTEVRSRAKVVDTIIANMERWRWLPRDLGTAYVMLNIPDYTLKVVDHEKTVWSTRVVVGKPGRMATPLLSETIKYITVNPTWNVPPSIIRNEYLPALQQDPYALERIGLKVAQNRNGTIRIYQPPGAGNALGRLRFNFPNKFLVYQHDTPDKYLFAHDKRAYSHGCMRVQNPDQYAEVLLSIAQPGSNYTAERIRKMYGAGERNINLERPIPVHLTYQTAFVDDAGNLQLREDIYGRDAQVLALLTGSESRVADRPVERREASAKPVTARLPARQQESTAVTNRGFFGLFFR